MTEPPNELKTYYPVSTDIATLFCGHVGSGYYNNRLLTIYFLAESDFGGVISATSSASISSVLSTNASDTTSSFSLMRMMRTPCVARPSCGIFLSPRRIVWPCCEIMITSSVSSAERVLTPIRLPVLVLTMAERIPTPPRACGVNWSILVRLP